MECLRRLTLALFLLFWPAAVYARLSSIAGRTRPGAADEEGVGAPAADDGQASAASPGRRALGGLLPEFFDLDPRSTVPRVVAQADVRPTAVTVTVYLVASHHHGGRAPTLPRPMSLFTTDALRRHGTGRIEWDVVEYAGCDVERCTGPDMRPRSDWSAGAPPAPCLAVVGHANPCKREVLECNYPRCRTVLVGDELCQQGWSDLRTYHTSNMPAKGYVPLGMRSDSWQSLVEIRAEVGHQTKPPSGRRYAFNAMFSISTNAGRERLSYIIEGNAPAWSARTGMEAYVRMSNWFGDPNVKRSDQSTTEEYMRVLLDSVFTVSPAGHNPECFRMYEAGESFGHRPESSVGHRFRGMGKGSHPPNPKRPSRGGFHPHHDEGRHAGSGRWGRTRKGRTSAFETCQRAGVMIRGSGAAAGP